MGLFQKNPYGNSDVQQLYSFGQNRTVLIVGLGNKGRAYQKTRHNIGFHCLDAFADKQEFEPWTEKKDLKAQLTVKNLGDSRVILCKPSTMMNLSGEAVQAVAHFYKIAPQNMLVIHDELDIPFGQIRVRAGGSSAGHNGLKSLLQYVDNVFTRVRIGVGGDRGQMEGADYVLAAFSKEEQAHLKRLDQEAVSMITEFVFGGQLAAETRSFIV